MEVGNVNSKHFVLALKGKSVLDSCDDENEDMEDNDVNLGSTDSDETYYYFGSDTEVNESQEDQYIVAPAGKQQPEADNGMVDGEIVDKLVKERVLSKAGKNIYIANKQKATDYDFNMVKEEIEGQAVALGDKTPQVDDHLYSKALYHALRVTYATIPKLESNNLKQILAWSMRVNSPNQELMLLRPAY